MRIFLILLIVFFLSSCASSITIDGKTCEPVGLFNLNDKCDGTKYKISKGNLIWSILAFETVVVPIILIGKKLYEPVETNALK